MMILLCTCARTQQYHYNLKFKLSLKNFADTIAIEVENGRIYVPVTIGGETYQFLLDTGASMCGIYDGSPIAPDGSLQSQAPQGSSAHVGIITSHDANGQASSTKVVSLPDLQIGRLTISGYHANLLRRPPNTHKSVGVIGFDIFNKGLFGKIDTRNHWLILTDRRNHFGEEQGYEARYRLNRHVPFVALSPFGGHIELARFDTGDRSLYTISRQSYDSALNGFPAEIESQVEGRTTGRLRVSHSGAETTDEVVALCLHALKWGNFSFRNVRTLTAQGESAIGSGILNHGTIIINPRRQRLVFQPFDGGRQCWIDNHLPDIYYVPDSHGLPLVGLVWENSEPYRQGFRQGDVITAINGIAINSVAEFTRYPFIANQTYTVTVRSKNGSIRQIKLTK